MATISGFVSNCSGGRGISGMLITSDTVIAESEFLGSLTAKTVSWNGSFKLTVPPGTHRVTFTGRGGSGYTLRPGFYPKTVTVKAPGTVNLCLTKKSLPPPPVTEEKVVEPPVEEDTFLEETEQAGYTTGTLALDAAIITELREEDVQIIVAEPDAALLVEPVEPRVQALWFTLGWPSLEAWVAAGRPNAGPGDAEVIIEIEEREMPSLYPPPVPPEEEFPKIIAQSLRWPTPTDTTYSGPAVRLTFVYRSEVDQPSLVKLSRVLSEMDKQLRKEDPTIFRVGFRVRERRVIHGWEYRYEILYADPTGDFPALAVIVGILLLILGILIVTWGLIYGPQALKEVLEAIEDVFREGTKGLGIVAAIVVAGLLLGRRRKK